MLCLKVLIESGNKFGYVNFDDENLEDLTKKDLNTVLEAAYMVYGDFDYLFLDEAQNATSSQLKMFLTRMGRNAKFVITGDITQIDLPRHQQSGLVQAMHILDGINGISFINLDNSDVIRHKLVTKIIRAYERNTDTPHEEPPQLQD